MKYEHLCYSISGINGANSPAVCQRCCESQLLTLKVKMSENLVFYSETKSIVETVIQTAVDVGHLKEEKSTKEPNMRREVSQRLINGWIK